MRELLAINILDILLNADFILGVVIFVFAIVGIKRGFCAQLLGFIGSIAAIFIAALLAKPLLNVILQNTQWSGSIANGLYNTVSSTLGDFGQITSGQITAAAEGLTLPAAVKETIINYASSLGEADINFASVVSRVIAEYILLIICFIALFLVIRIIVAILKRVFETITELPIIKQVDMVLGLALSLVKCWIVISLGVFIINLLPFEALDGFKQSIDNSFIYAAITKFNLFDLLLKLVTI